MDPKREISGVDIRSLVREFEAYKGSIFDKSYCYGKELVRFRMRKPGIGRNELLVGIGNTKSIHFAAIDNVPKAPDKAIDFAMKLRSKLRGKRLKGIEQYGFDRVLKIIFEGRENEILVVAELFGDGNLSIVGEDNKVYECLRTVRLHSRTVASGKDFEFPPPRVDPFALDYGSFVDLMDTSESDLVRSLATQINFGGTYAEEICLRSSVEKQCLISSAAQSDYERIYEEITKIGDKIKNGKIQPRIYYEEEVEVDVTPFSLALYEHLDYDTFDTFNSAIDNYFSDGKLEISDENEEVGEEVLDRYERIIASQKSALKQFSQEARSIRGGVELLYSNYGVVEEIMEEICQGLEKGEEFEQIGKRMEASERSKIVELIGMNQIEKIVEVRIGGIKIVIYPWKNIEQNASLNYNLAKKIEGKYARAKDAISVINEELNKAKTDKNKSDLERGTGAEMKIQNNWLSRTSIPIKKSKYWFDRFRWFRSSDGFLIISGKNADQNEELVKKYISKGDRIFHTQTPGAPITILKAFEPGESPKEIEIPEKNLLEAAKFALSCSSVWKEGRRTDDVYMVTKDQISKTPESGEYLTKGSFVVRGERTYFRNMEIGFAIGVTCAPETRVIGGPPSAVIPRSVISIEIEPGQFSREDVAKKIYRYFCESFRDGTFVRKITGPDEISQLIPAGNSTMIE
jgi:predicted ribosome quality control (RQC) complex YloA/Tae2 family protein